MHGAFGCDIAHHFTLQDQKRADGVHLLVLCAWQYHMWNASSKQMQVCCNITMRSSAI